MLNSSGDDELFRLIQSQPLFSLDLVKFSDPGFKIPISSQSQYDKIAQRCPEIKNSFEVKLSKLGGHTLTNWIFSEEDTQHCNGSSLMNKDNIWIELLQLFVPFKVHSDEFLASSYPKIRPDLIFRYKNVQFLRYLSLDSALSISEAEVQLKSTLFEASVFDFPSNNMNFGLISSERFINLYLITASEIGFDHRNPSVKTAKKYSLSLLNSFSTNLSSQRCSFFLQMINILRWIATFTSSVPVRDFHLTPDIEEKTKKGDFLLWADCKLFKTFKEGSISSLQRDIMTTVLKKLYDHTVWGEFSKEEPNRLEITHIGTPVKKLLIASDITPAEAMEQVKRALEKLYTDLGLVYQKLGLDDVYGRFEEEFDFKNKKKRTSLKIFLSGLHNLQSAKEIQDSAGCGSSRRESQDPKYFSPLTLQAQQIEDIRQEVEKLNQNNQTNT